MRLHLLQWQSFFSTQSSAFCTLCVSLSQLVRWIVPFAHAIAICMVACTVRSRLHNTNAAEHSGAAACMPYGLCMSYEILLWVPQDNDFYPETLCYSLDAQCLFCRFVHLCVYLLDAIRMTEVCVAWLFGCRSRHTARERKRARE